MYPHVKNKAKDVDHRNYFEFARGTGRDSGMSVLSVPNGTTCLTSANWLLKHAYRNDTTLQTLNMSSQALRKLIHWNGNAGKQNEQQKLG